MRKVRADKMNPGYDVNFLCLSENTNWGDSAKMSKLEKSGIVGFDLLLASLNHGKMIYNLTLHQN